MTSPAEKLAQKGSELSYRPYKPEDYTTAQKWWLKQNQAYLERFLLPNTGVVVEHGGEPVGMGWVYFSNSGLAWLGFPVVSPGVGPKIRILTLLKIFSLCEDMAKQNGFLAMQMLSDKSTLNKMAETMGFSKVRHHDYFIKILQSGASDDV